MCKCINKMGIKDLCQFLRKREPELVVEIPLNKFSGHSLAIDASVYLYKFISINNQFQGNWIDMFISLIQWIRKNGIQPIFIFDGAPPKEKEHTQNQRREQRLRNEEKCKQLEALIDSLDEYNINQNLPEKIKIAVDTVLEADSEYMPRKEVLVKLNEKYKKLNGQAVRISKEDLENIQKILEYMGLPWMKAIGEAERACAWLCKWKHVSGVITSDSDILVYPDTIFIQDVKINKNECTIIRHVDVLDQLEFSNDQFKDFCIMCGTDYNDRIPGIGPVKAFDLLQKHSSIEKIAKEEKINIEPLNHQTVRQLFTVPNEDSPSELFEKLRIFPKQGNAKELALILMKNNSRFSAEDIIVNYSSKFKII